MDLFVLLCTLKVVLHLGLQEGFESSPDSIWEPLFDWSGGEVL